MQKGRTIKRIGEEPGEHSFARLRKEGIELSQQLSGNAWTDYNTHDPGLTILEQLCFALTDLIYRTEFPVSDYLCDEKGRIDFDKLALLPPGKILFNRPVTKLDIRKSLLDAVPSISDIWITQSQTDADTDNFGLYHAVVRKKANQAQALGLEHADVDRQVYLAYQQQRNLAEDISTIDIVKEVACDLVANISIKPGIRPATVLAQIYFQAATCLDSEVKRHAFDSGHWKGKSLDERFRGPLTVNGLIDDIDLTDDKAGYGLDLTLSELLSIVGAIEGVEYIRSLELCRPGGKSSDYELPLELAADSTYRIKVPRAEQDAVRVKLVMAGSVVAVPKAQLLAELNKLYFGYEKSKPSAKNDELLYSMPSGTYRDISNYQSIQNHFPATYGINQFGVPVTYPVERRAQALQLKGYLLLFEQVMANYSANLGSLDKLFSTDLSEAETYYSAALNNKEISNLAEVYPSNAKVVVKKALQKIDRAVDRKQRLLDYLLALYGVDFSQHFLRHSNFYYTAAEVEQVIMSNKVRLLESVSVAGHDRGAGFDYTRPYWDLHKSSAQENTTTALVNVSGLHFRLSILLGFKYQGGRSLVREVLNQGLSLLPHDEYMRCYGSNNDDELPQEDPMVLRARTEFLEKPQVDKRLHQRYLIVRDHYSAIPPMKHGVISEALLRSGVNEDNFQHFSPTEDGKKELFIRLSDLPFPESGEKPLWVLGSYREKVTGGRMQSYLHQFLVHLNIESEGLHVVEHILLRPDKFSSASAGLKAAYANRVSVVFPAWTARCNDPEFRTFAEQAVRENCPAHIYPECFWLDFSSMCGFELLYRDWLDMKMSAETAGQNADSPDAAAAAVLAFLERQKSIFGEQTGYSNAQQLNEQLVLRIGKYIDRLREREQAIVEFSNAAAQVVNETPKLRLLNRLKAQVQNFNYQLVEHIQLLPEPCKPQLEELEFYYFRISVLLPVLPCLDAQAELPYLAQDIQALVEKLVSENCRSHIRPDFYWLKSEEMKAVEQLVHKCEFISQSRPPTTEVANARARLKVKLEELAVKRAG